MSSSKFHIPYIKSGPRPRVYFNLCAYYAPYKSLSNLSPTNQGLTLPLIEHLERMSVDTFLIAIIVKSLFFGSSLKERALSAPGRRYCKSMAKPNMNFASLIVNLPEIFVQSMEMGRRYCYPV